jgi:hypothetical protein
MNAAPRSTVHAAESCRVGWLGVRRKEPTHDLSSLARSGKGCLCRGYVEHLQAETFPSIRELPGFVSASILRRSVPEGVEFLVVTNWASVEAIRAVVPQKVHEMMIDYDRIVRHYEVVS